MSSGRYEAPEVGAMVERMLRALARRAGNGEAEAVEQLARLERVVAGELARGVAEHRAGVAGASWQTIGELVGMSRQNAHRRFAPADADLARARAAAAEPGSENAGDRAESADRHLPEQIGDALSVECQQAGERHAQQQREPEKADDH